MFQWLKENTQGVRAALANEFAKFKNKKQLEAVTATCAMIAAADGEISAAEKQKMIGFIQQSPELKVFKTEDVIASFTAHVNKFDFDIAIGRAEALKVIGGIRDNVEASRLCVRVGCVIGSSDGNFDDKEKAACRDICRELGLNPADFDL